MKKSLKSTVIDTYNLLVLHWKTPPLGKYVNFKEIIAYGIGGMGVQFIICFASLIALSSTSFLVGNTIGIKPMHLQFMSVMSTLIGFGITIARSYIIDNSRLKHGKFIPWLATMGIPTVAISIIFVWLPYETMSYLGKIIAVFICFNLLQCFFPFYQQSYTDLSNVISPDSHERTDIVSISSIVYSFAPSLTGALIPFLSKFTGGLNNITTYRIIHPIIAIIGLALCYVTVFGTKERIIVAKTHVSHFKFSDAFRSVAKNKYFWITSLAGWLGFLESAVSVIIGWTFIYGYPDRMGTYAIATTLIGNAALWAMILCPFAIRTIGKRNLLIWCNVANILLISALYPLFHNIYALIIIYYLNGFVGAFAIVYMPGINADMRDYQQYYTGERIDGMFGAVGIIGSFVGMFTGLVLPYIYQTLGLEDNYDVLEVASFREDMFTVLIIAAVIGAAMNCVPYFFYDLTETKQKGIVKVLKIRALFEDYGNGILKDEELVDAIDIITEANLLYESRTEVVTKDDIKNLKRRLKYTDIPKNEKNNELRALKKKYQEYKDEVRTQIKDRTLIAKAMPKSSDAEKADRKAAIKNARKENRSYKKLNDDISVCDFVINEMRKFDTDRVKAQVKRAENDEKSGVDAIYHIDKRSLLRSAKELPHHTYEQREIRSDAINHAKSIISCHKNIMKYYPNGLTVPDSSALEKAEEIPENTFAEKRLKKKTIRAFVNENSHYTHSVKVLLDAKRLITEQKNYGNYDEILAKYDDAKQRADELFEQKRLEIERLESERKADIERRKQERLAKKQ